MVKTLAMIKGHKVRDVIMRPPYEMSRNASLAVDTWQCIAMANVWKSTFSRWLIRAKPTRPDCGWPPLSVDIIRQELSFLDGFFPFFVKGLNKNSVGLFWRGSNRPWILIAMTERSSDQHFYSWHDNNACISQLNITFFLLYIRNKSFTTCPSVHDLLRFDPDRFLSRTD